MESRTSTERSHTTQNDYDEIEIILKPHPKETTHSSKRFLKTTSNATGKQAEEFDMILSKRLKFFLLFSESFIKIFINTFVR
jgi:hypothetical protein